MVNAAYIRAYRHKRRALADADAQHEEFMQFLSRAYGVPRRHISATLCNASPKRLAQLKAKFLAERDSGDGEPN